MLLFGLISARRTATDRGRNRQACSAATVSASSLFSPVSSGPFPMPKACPFCPASRLILLRFRDVARRGMALAMPVLMLSPAMAQPLDTAPHPASALANMGAVQRAELHARTHGALSTAEAPPIRVSQQPVQHVPDSESAAMRQEAEAALEARLGLGISISEGHATRFRDGKGGESQWYMCGSTTRLKGGMAGMSRSDSDRFVMASSGALLLESQQNADFGWPWAHVCSPENAMHPPSSPVPSPARTAVSPPVSAGGKGTER
ncbi:Hypothetical protein GbCGDNIH6_1567 [Granulibacter bethesdensis]|nr:Hypothetical protein GbCGDNIH6_1567 [Granulibacter bethesdensis]